MKTKMLGLAGLLLLGTMAGCSKSKTAKLEVLGNCGMCETRIENAANSVEGVTSADWNVETKLLTVSYDASATDENKIHLAIANAGHDTPLHKADDEVYNNLHTCCKYERSGSAKSSSSEHNH
jgi:periplasmic mercuric ion binding protein